MTRLVGAQPLIVVMGVAASGKSSFGVALAERLGVGFLDADEAHPQANIDKMAAGTDNPEINRLLGSEGDLGKMIGLDKAWAWRAIKMVGNYGEVFEKHIGPKTPIGLERGLNALWTKGGILYSPPFR